MKERLAGASTRWRTRARNHKIVGVGSDEPLDEKVRQQALQRDGKCLKCGVTNCLTIDHIVPRGAGINHHLDNLQTLCSACNATKGCRVWDANVERAVKKYGSLAAYQRHLRQQNFSEDWIP